MTTKENILLYFNDINYAYNDCTRLDSLEKGLSELEEVVHCKDCRYFHRFSNDWADCDFHDWYRAEPNEYDFCSKGERKTE